MKTKSQPTGSRLLGTRVQSPIRIYTRQWARLTSFLNSFSEPDEKKLSVKEVQLIVAGMFIFCGTFVITPISTVIMALGVMIAAINLIINYLTR